jgi:hypothetical protein
MNCEPDERHARAQHAPPPTPGRIRGGQTVIRRLSATLGRGDTVPPHLSVQRVATHTEVSGGPRNVPAVALELAAQRGVFGGLQWCDIIRRFTVFPRR